MAPIQQFKTAFWSQKQPEMALPDFNSGFSVLHQKLGQSKIENEEMITFFKDRIALEETYANRLTDQNKVALKSSGFGRDEGAGLLKCFSQLKEASQRIGEQHKTTASEITKYVLTPLQEFHENYKHSITSSKQAIDSTLKQFDALIKDVEKAKGVYHRKCRDADKAEELTLKNASVSSPVSSPTALPAAVADVKQESADQPLVNDDVSPKLLATTATPNNNSSNLINIQLGNQILSQTDFDSLIRRMRQEITVSDHRVPILGTYKNTSTGEDIAIWLQHHLGQCKDSPAMADIVGQQLIQPYNILRLIGQRGSKFTASFNSVYQWRVANDDDATSIASSSDNSSSYTATLGGLMDKIAPVPTSHNNATATSASASASAITAAEEPHKKARREAEKADQTYRTAVLKLDQMRMAIEEAMFAHLSKMEQVELHRIEKLKQIISTFIASLSVAIPQDKLVVEEIMVFQESLKPDQDIQFIVQQYAVSAFSPKAVLYDNYYHGVLHDQVFGVSLEELGKYTPDKVPKFITTILMAIEKGIEKNDKAANQDIWSTPCALDRVHSICMELNIGSDNLSLELFEKYEPELLVASLRYYLLELPECLMTYEFYDPVEALLGSNADQYESLRLTTFSNLVATLPATHFETLKAIFGSITSFIEKVSATDETIQNIAQSLGPVILRARIDTFSTLNSKVSAKFIHELIAHYNNIFSEATLKLHSESEKRRLARPIVVPAQPITVNVKRSGSLMSFMRPTINTAEELNKWTVNSVMGVFQKTGSTSSSNDQTTPLSPSNNRATVPLSFASGISRHDSPPSSPYIKYNANIPNQDESPKVMFDGVDHIFDEEDSAETDEKPKGSLKEAKMENAVKNSNEQVNNTSTQKDASNTPKRPMAKQEIDSSFFDDDDEEE